MNFLGLLKSLLYNGSRFKGSQRSKGNSYEVEVIIQFVDEANSYLCGYLKIKGLTFEFPTLTTFFDGEIISKRFPFLTRKWDADEGKMLLINHYASHNNEFGLSLVFTFTQLARHDVTTVIYPQYEPKQRSTLC